MNSWLKPTFPLRMEKAKVSGRVCILSVCLFTLENQTVEMLAKVTLLCLFSYVAHFSCHGLLCDGSSAQQCWRGGRP